MKRNKKLLLIFFLLACFLFVPKSGRAIQEVDDYLFQQEKYRQVYEEFIRARDQYLKYKTLTAKTGATEATKKLVQQRNKTLQTYFLALKWKLNNTAGVGEERDALDKQLSEEINWLTEQEKRVENLSPPSLEDLFVISDDFEAKKESFQRLSYQSLTAVLSGKVKDLHSQSVSLTNLLTDRVAQTEAPEPVQLKIWVDEVKNKNNASQEQLETVKTQAELLAEKKEQQLIKTYSEIQLYLENAKNSLDQAFSFQQEIYSYLKNE